MKKIIFDNTAAGFPADEQFMRVVDEHREAMIQLCNALFNDQLVILSGLTIDRTTNEDNGVMTHATVINEGAVWFNNDILRVNRTKLAGEVDIKHIYLDPVSEKITGIYHNGENHDTYYNNRVEIKVTDAPVSLLRKMKKLTAFVRLDYFRPRHTEQWVNKDGDVRYSITASEYMGTVTMRGRVSLPVRVAINRTVFLTDACARYGFKGEDSVLTFLCPTHVQGENPGDLLMLRGMFRVLSNGSTAIGLLIEKEEWTADTNAIVDIDINAFYSI